MTNIKALAHILFEISCTKIYFEIGAQIRNYTSVGKEQKNNKIKKNKKKADFLFNKSYVKSQNPSIYTSTVMRHNQRETNGRTDGWTDGKQVKSNMSHLLRNWGHNKPCVCHPMTSYQSSSSAFERAPVCSSGTYPFRIISSSFPDGSQFVTFDAPIDKKCLPPSNFLKLCHTSCIFITQQKAGSLLTPAATNPIKGTQ